MGKWVIGCAVSALAALALLASGAVAETVNDTVQYPSETYVQRTVVCGGQFADVTYTDDGVIHSTARDDGTYHIAGTFKGVARWVQDGVDFAIRYSLHFSENSNDRSANGTFTLSGAGRGSDGTSMRVRVLGHFTLAATGELARSFDHFSVDCRGPSA